MRSQAYRADSRTEQNRVTATSIIDFLKKTGANIVCAGFYEIHVFP